MDSGNSPALTVRQVMTPDPLMVEISAPVRDVVRLMNERRFGAMLITDRGRLVGIFSERDVLRLVAADDPGWLDRRIDAVMTRSPIRIHADLGWEDAVALMQNRHVRHLPVDDGGRIIGIVSSRQLMARRTEHLDQVVNRKTFDLQERDRALQDQMRLAGRLLERALLPQQPPSGANVDWAIRYAPLDSLGGDYYDFVNMPDGSVGVLVADAAGHSVAAAMVAVMARIAFAEAVRDAARPAEVLSRMNDRLTGLTEDRFVTAFFAQIDRSSRKLVCANAGHPRPLHFHSRDRRCSGIGLAGLPLGISEEATYEESVVEISPGDRLVLYTDGVIECKNADGENFGSRRLGETITASAGLDAGGLLRRIDGAIDAHRGPVVPDDDFTILIAEFR